MKVIIHRNDTLEPLTFKGRHLKVEMQQGMNVVLNFEDVAGAVPERDTQWIQFIGKPKPKKTKAQLMQATIEAIEYPSIDELVKEALATALPPALVVAIKEVEDDQSVRHARMNNLSDFIAEARIAAELEGSAYLTGFHNGLQRARGIITNTDFEMLFFNSINDFKTRPIKMEVEAVPLEVPYAAPCKKKRPGTDYMVECEPEVR